MNSKLITNSIVSLFNNASTIIPFYVSILSKPIFTITSLNSSLLSFIFYTSIFLPLAPVRLLPGFFTFLNIVFLSFFTSPLLGTPTFITLLVNTLNLFKDCCIAISFPFLALQFLTIYFHPPQLKHFLFYTALSLFSFLPFSYYFCCLYSFSTCFSSFILIFSIFLHSFSILLVSLFFLLFNFLSFFFLLSFSLPTIPIQSCCPLIPLLNTPGLMF